MPWAMIILSVLVNEIEDPPLPLLSPLPPLPPGVGVGDEPSVVSDLDRSREPWPSLECWVKEALGELEPGFVRPEAQMIFSVPTVET